MIFLICDFLSIWYLPGQILLSLLLLVKGYIYNLFGLCPLFCFCLHGDWIIMKYRWGPGMLIHSIRGFLFWASLTLPSFHCRRIIYFFYTVLLLVSTLFIITVSWALWPASRLIFLIVLTINKAWELCFWLYHKLSIISTPTFIKQNSAKNVLASTGGCWLP